MLLPTAPFANVQQFHYHALSKHIFYIYIYLYSPGSFPTPSTHFYQRWLIIFWGIKQTNQPTNTHQHHPLVVVIIRNTTQHCWHLMAGKELDEVLRPSHPQMDKNNLPNSVHFFTAITPFLRLKLHHVIAFTLHSPLVTPRLPFQTKKPLKVFLPNTPKIRAVMLDRWIAVLCSLVWKPLLLF